MGGEGREGCGYIVPGTSDTIKHNLGKPVLTVWGPVIIHVTCLNGTLLSTQMHRHGGKKDNDQLWQKK